MHSILHRKKSAKEDKPIELDSDQDLDIVFDRAWEHYQAITGESLAPSARHSFDAITNDIQATIESERAVTNSKAVTVIDKVSKCFSKFGSILASTASAGFPGSTQCWNAVGLILGAASEYKAIFDGFITLMERTVAFMENLNIFLEKKTAGSQILDPVLRQKTYDILAHMLTLLARSHKLIKSKREQFKAAVGVFLFSSDEGVKSSLINFETSMRELTGLEVTTVLANVENMAVDMLTFHDEVVEISNKTLQNTQEIISSSQRIEDANKHLVGAFDRLEAVAEHMDERTMEVQASNERIESMQSKQMSDKKSKEDQRVIAETLQIKIDSNNRSQPWSDRNHDFRRTRIPETGQWLLEMPEYLNWSHIFECHSKVITLAGEQGYGKSYACSHVVDDLLHKYSKGNLSKLPGRVSIAYYYFNKTALDSKSAKREAAKETTTSMLARIIYQWALVNPDYAKAVAAACGQSDGLSQARKMWATLVTGLADSMLGTFFIVIDGYTKDDEEEDPTAFETFVELVNHCTLPESRIRIFISGPEEDLGQLIPSRVSFNCQIQLGKPKPQFTLHRQSSSLLPPDTEASATPNESDLIAFASARIDDMCKKEPDLARIMKDPQLDAAKTLARGVRGDYNSLVAKLDQIVTSDGEDEELKDIITRASESREESLRRIIEELHAKLKPSEMEELNALLAWRLVSFDSSLSLLQNALSFATGKGRGLQSHIKTRYRPLLRLKKDQEVELWSPDLREMLEKLTNDEDTMRTSESSQLQRSEVKIIERVVKTFCGDELYEKFDFESFFKAKLNNRLVRIKVESENAAHALIVQTCLQVLCEKPNEDRFQELCEYAAYWVYEHLACVEPDQVDKKSIETIGQRLVSLFWDPAIIDAFWKDHRVRWLRWDFGLREENRNIDAVTKWLNAANTALKSSGNPEQNRWIESIASGEKYNLMSRVAERLIERWFCSMRPNAAGIQAACEVYFKVVATGAGSPDAPGENLLVEQAQQFVSWVKQNQEFAISDAQWKYRTGALFRVYGHTKEALSLCTEALNEGLNHWSLLLCIAQCQFDVGAHQAALHLLRRIQEQSQELEQEGSDDAVLWEDIIPLEAECHLALKDVKSAVSSYQSILEQELEEKHQHIHTDAVRKLFKLWNQRQEHDEILALLQSWCDEDSASKGIVHWLSILAEDEDCHAWINTAALHTNKQQLVISAYEQAIRGAPPDDTQGAKENLAMLRYYHAAILFHSSRQQENHDRALDSLVGLVKELGYDTEMYFPIYIAIKGLARFFLDKAVEHGIRERPVPVAALSYAKRFEELIALNLPAVQNLYDTANDPRVTVARMKVLAGDMAGAKEMLVEGLRNALDEWPESEEADITGRIYTIVATCMVLEDNESAITAWRLMEPKRKPEEQQNEGLGVSLFDDALDPPASHEIVQDATATPQQINELEIQPGHGVVAELSIEGGTIEKLPQDQGDSSSAPISTNDDPLAGIEADTSYFCDGCGTTWRVIGDLYACKDCICLQFCKSCHEKLQSGQMSNFTCNASHTHIYVPPFDRHAWERKPADHIRLGDGTVSRREWLNRLRAEWGLQQDQIDAHKQVERRERLAARRIARAITRSRRDKMAQVVEQAQADACKVEPATALADDTAP